MSIRTLFVPTLILAAVLTGCMNVDVTNPNAPDSETFWATESDAIQGINATYNGLEQNGVYGRWLGFPTDIRADDGKSNSPWTDLANWNKFSFNAYDFEPNHAVWYEHYNTIFRANLVIANVPEIDMDPTLRDRIVGEAKFIRGLMYFNLINLYGGVNLPLQTEPSTVGDMPTTPGAAAVWSQIEQDFTEAAQVLPATYTGADIGRATSGAAEGMLGKALMMQRKWSEASAVLEPLIASGRYSLLPDYTELFTYAGNNTQEGLFEVQFGSRSTLSQGVRGLNQGKFFGPCGPSWCDGEPTTWLFTEFMQDTTEAGDVDPRLDATLFWRPDEMAYGMTMSQRFADRYADPNRIARGDSVIFWKKYTEYWLNTTDQDWDAPLTFKVLRYADVLLLEAEALNEQGQTSAAYPYIDQVRARVDLAPLPAGLSQSEMRDRILHERLVELADEHQRWLDLERQNLLTSDGLPMLRQHDPEFDLFQIGKGELLPIPTPEVNLNPNVSQNPGW